MNFPATYRRLIPLLLATYILAVGATFLYFNMRLTIEWVAAILFGAALLSGRASLFIRDWGVFLVVLVAWQVASPLATQFAFPWHLQELIDADKLMFLGQVPPLWLQQHLYHPGALEPWDVLAATMYMLHFLVPLVAGFLLWMTNRRLFQQFAVAFVVVAVAGFATYILYPAVPPWMAAKPLYHVHNEYVVGNGGRVYLPGVQNLFLSITGNWYNPYHGNISIHWLHLHYDQVGAIPSEHAAYPLLFFLFLRRQFGRIAYLSLIYIALVLFAITYLGQHYMIDAVVGFAYAVVGYLLAVHAAPALGRFARARRGIERTRPLHRPGLADLEEA